MIDALWCRQWHADPSALLVDDGDAPLTRVDFEALVEHQMQRLAGQGVGTRDIVAWLGHNHPAMLAALVACERIGAVLMPLNWRLAHGELLAQMVHAGTASLVVDDGLRDSGIALETAWRSAGGAERQTALPGDVLLVYTSGTTGQPKGAMHTAAQVAANAQAAIAVQGLHRDTRALAVLPMFHVGGLCIQLLPTVLAGGTVRLHPRFDPGLWLADVECWRPTTSVLVPATMRTVMDHPHWHSTDLSSLRFLMTGSSVVPSALIEAFHARGVPVSQVCGSTETGPFSIALRPDDAVAHVGSTGSVAPGVQVRLVDETGRDVPDGEVGDIRVRGSNVMRGYHRMPTHPDFVDGWFHSGDRAKRDAQGRYEVVGRSKDMIISGGENIYPAEIENLVIGVPGVAECAVVGLPDERWGETPVLAVVAHAGAKLDTQVVRSAYESQLARFKHPRRVLLLPSLPKTALGKVQKAELAQLIRALPLR